MRAGDVLGGRFVLESVAGEGGMGVVWRARDRDTDAVVALKVGRRLQPDEAARFEREAASLALMSHPGIVRYVDRGTTSAGELYLVMEWLEGEVLAERLERGALSLAETLALGRRVAQALAVAHDHGIVHRDIKPSNLLLPGGQIERAKLIDFGVARVPQIAPGLTGTGFVLGTPGYMSPEQARGEPVGPATDAFALGCVLWECLTGVPAFTGGHEMAILLKVILAELPPITAHCPQVPASVGDLLSNLMAKDEARRPPDGAAIVESFARLGQVQEARAPAPVLLESLGESEQRMVCLLLVGGRPPLRDTVESDVAALEQARRAQELRELVARHGGKRFELLDGSFAVTLQGRGAATDQAAQAALCALAMHTALPSETVAVVTGRSVVGGHVPVGEAIDRAAAMLRAVETSAVVPPPACVWLDDVSAALLDARFLVAAEPSGLRLVGVRERVDEARRLLGRPTTCVGRARELSELRDLLDECVARPVARAVLVTAPAGAGKSRLRFEMVRDITRRGLPAEVWLARGDPLGAGSPFGLLGQILRAASGIRGSDHGPTRSERLRARVARFVESSEVPRVTAFLGEIAGARSSDDDSVQLRAARRDPILMADQTRRAWLDFVLAECRRHPVVLILEDIHWGDVPTMRLMLAALHEAQELPLFVLALGRPEVTTLFPELTASTCVAVLRLGELTPDASADLVRQVLGDAVDAAAVSRLVERSAGNALYLEELIRAFADGGEDGEAELPPTVLALLGARLGALPDPMRLVLRAGSVFGRSFWGGGLLALLGETPDHVGAQLRKLLERELIVQPRESRFSEETEYRFRHALVREAAHGMLTEQDLRLGHRLAGAWLESRGETDAAVLAGHFERGGAPKLAARWWRRAAEQALNGSDLAAVRARCERAEACGAQGEELGASRALEALAHYWEGSQHPAANAAADALALLPRSSPAWYQAVMVEVLSAAELGDVETVIRRGAELCTTTPGEGPDAAAALAATVSVTFLLGRPDVADPMMPYLDALAAAAVAGDPAVAARILRARAAAALYHGETERALRMSLAAGEQAALGGDFRAVSSARLMGGVALGELGDVEGALAALRALEAEAQQLGLPYYSALVRLNVARLEGGRTGPTDRVLRELSDLVELFRSQGNRRLLGSACLVLADALQDRGDFAAAEPEARTALEMHADFPHARCRAVSSLAGALRGADRAREAVALAREAMALLDRLQALDLGESRVRMTSARVYADAGHVAEAHATLRAARERVRARASGIVDPRLRAAFMRDNPDNAAVLEHAHAWLPGED